MDLTSVRALEDFIINECMYTGIIRGKLDQKKRSLEVRGALSRDIQPPHLDEMIATFGHWYVTWTSAIIKLVCSRPPAPHLARTTLLPSQRSLGWLSLRVTILSRTRLSLTTRIRACTHRLETSDFLLGDIEEKVSSAAVQAAAQDQHKELIEARADELRNKVRASDMEKGALANAFIDAGDVDMAGPHVGSRGKRRR